MQNRPEDHRWIWFFVILLVLSGVAVLALIRYNLGQQLKMEELHKARELWEKSGPPSYRLVYTVKRGEAEPETYVVHVRHRHTEFATLEGRKLESRRFSMDYLFDDIETFLERDRQKGKPSTYLRAVFDAKDGHVLWFVRRVMGSRERVEIIVQELEPL